MLDTLKITSPQGANLTLPLDDIVNGYSIQDIQGLDPVKAEIASSQYPNQAGEQFHSSSRGKRNIILKLGLEANYSTQTVRQLRQGLYDYFMPQSDVSLQFLDDDGSAVDISGKVEDLSAPLFTAKPAATISILCLLPDFIDTKKTTVTGASVPDMTETSIDYTGTSATGFLFHLQIDRALTEFSVKSRSPDGVQRSMDFTTTGLQAGDTIEISTVTGAKGVYLLRAGSRTSLLYALAPYSPWLNLYKGSNAFRVLASGNPMPYTLEYKNKYGGI